LYVFRVVNIFNRDQSNEMAVSRVVVERELNQGAHGLDRWDGI
jgi:hypothetical protein